MDSKRERTGKQGNERKAEKWKEKNERNKGRKRHDTNTSRLLLVCTLH
jgi:hypothetical protein